MSEVLKCKFCDWTCKKGYKNKKGVFVSGYSLLLNHCHLNHTTEFMELQDKLDSEFAPKDS
jgi:hypothetical protein